MKLLAGHIGGHDENITYWDGERLHYHKLERRSQSKHEYHNDLWQWRYDIESLWGINLNEIDDAVFCYDRGEYSLPDRDPSLGPFPWHYMEHHYAHALSSWVVAPREADVHVVIDSLGNRKVWSVWRGGKCVASLNNEMGSIGEAMVSKGYYFGLTGNDLDFAGKIMGLQSYGKIDEDYLNIIRKYDIYNIDAIFSNENWFKYKGSELVGRLDALNHMTTVHKRVGEIIVDLFKQYVKPDELVSYSGGVAQNVIWNTEIRREFPNLIIPPHCNDEGISLGGIEFLRKKHNLPSFNLPNFPFIQSDVGTEEPTDGTLELAAEFLSQGKIVAMYHGHGEAGPRALGNRSIFMDPRISNGKELINKIKRREDFRPFGASVLSKYADEYFTSDGDNPYMLFVATAKTDQFPAITHVDGTCRVQTVNNGNTTLDNLLQKFYTRTNCPVLLNTSLNLGGKPIAAYPENAEELFYSTAIDVMIIGNKVLTK